MERLFSYGTLQMREVQLANFGRELTGQPDSLVGYRMEDVQLTDETVIRLSGKSIHKIVTGSENHLDEVEGVVFEITSEELAAADDYECEEYRRVPTILKSGLQAWVYVTA